MSVAPDDDPVTIYDGMRRLWAYCRCGSSMDTPDDERGQRNRENWAHAHRMRCAELPE